MQIHACPLERFQAPDVEKTQQILDLLQGWLDDDKTVYLCDLNGAERAGMLLACLFIERGMTAQQALEEINRLRFETQKAPAMRCPESQEQWERVIGWVKR
jgi:protein-tyrosine phosphatase